MSTRTLLSASAGASKCRTVDVCDIFGDNSGKALYRLDGNTNDESGNYHGTETAITYGGGAYERGAVFNGTSSKINIGGILNSSNVGSVSCFVKVNAITNFAGIFDKHVGSTSGFQIHLNSTTSKFHVSSWNISSIELDSITTVQVGIWYHVVCTVATNIIKLYINGNFDSSFAIGLPIVVNTVDAILGGDGVSSTALNGSIDQVRIFNRDITATEVATLYAECAPTSTVDNINPFEDGSLKAMYQFNGDATDKTGVYNGTATNVTYGTGKFGQCATGDGTTSKIITEPIFTTAMSFSLWGKVTTLGVTQSFFGEATSDGNNSSVRVGLALTATNTFQVSLGNGTLGLNDTSLASGFIVNTWYHLVLVINNTSVKLYRDGVLVGNYTSTVSIGSHVAGNFAFLTYGALAVANYHLRGSIDQARIFNKALTPMEVASLYNETTPLEEPMHSLVDPFKDGSGKALYRLDGNALDEIGNYNGTATSVLWGNGTTGRCASFDGNNGRVIQPPSTLSLNLSPYTISLKVKFNDVTTTQYLFQWQTLSSNVAMDLSGGIVFPFQINTSLTWVGVSALTSAVVNTWYHYVFLWDGSLVKFYIDGVLQGTAVCTSMRSYSGGFDIGRYMGGTYPLNGSIDQFRVFNRALTAAEVSTLYTEI